MKRKQLLVLLLRATALLAVCAICTLFASIVASSFVTHQLAALVKTHANSPAVLGQAMTGPTVELDFCEAAGIPQADLANFLADHARRTGFHSYPAHVTLQNDRGDYLADSRVIVKWNGGEHRLLVGKSAVIRFSLEPKKLPGLKIIAPSGYTRLRQRTISLGTAYDAEQRPETSHLEYQVHYDGETRSTLARELARFRADGDAVSYKALSDQLRRTSCRLDLPGHSSTDMTPAEIYRLRHDTIVIIANLYPDGRNTQGSGVVIDPSGVVVTAYHVIDKPTAVSRGVLTSDGKMYPVKEVLAADKSADVAILKIDADQLSAAPLSDGDLEGTQVTVIAHPHSQYFSLTDGRVSRYWAATSYGKVVVKMGITADFADGSSGAPIFNPQGEVTGIVNSTEPFGNQMVLRVACPVDALRQLIRATSDETT